MSSYRIDTDATARVAKVPAGTLNVWIQRRLLPGVQVGPRGRPRTFGLDDVMHIATMAALVRAGISSPLASEAAAFARPRWHDLKSTLVIGPSEDSRLRGGAYTYYVLSGD